MSTPATLGQGQKFLEFFTQADATREQVQNLLGNGDLLRPMLVADLSRVDRTAFAALLASPVSSIDWTPVGQYAGKLRDWNERFQLGLTDKQIDTLAAELPDHAGPHQPTGIKLYLSKVLKSDYEVAMKILRYEVEKLGVRFTEYFAPQRLSCFPGSEPPKSKSPSLGVAMLDIGTFWDPENGVVPREVRRQRSSWPGLEVVWLLALNPQVFLAMDGKAVPFMWAAGLVVGAGLPYFDRGRGVAFVGDGWDDDRWYGDSVVAFR
jgi:hypothetical protein